MNCILKANKGAFGEVKKMEKKDITKKMKEDIEVYKEFFYSRTCGGHIISYLNGFCAVGVFETPQDEGNTLWIYQIGCNRKGNKVEVHTNVECPLDEAEDLMQCLKIAKKDLKKMMKKG